MSSDAKSILSFLAVLLLAILAIDAFRGFGLTKSLLGLEKYFCDDRIYTREEGFYLVEDPTIRSVETKEYVRCGYKDRKGRVTRSWFKPVEEVVSDKGEDSGPGGQDYYEHIQPN